VVSVLVSIQHTNREPWSSILRQNLESGWLAQDIPDEAEVIVFEGQELGVIGQNLDRFHERVRFTPPWNRPLRLWDRWLAQVGKYVVPSYEVLESFPNGVTILRIFCPETLRHSIWKQLGMFSYFLEQSKADYLFSTTSGNFVSLDRLITLLDKVPRHGCFAGTIGSAGGPFVSGANRLMSRDVVALLIDAVHEFDAALLEDVAFGRAIEAKGVPFVELPTLNIQGVEQLEALTDAELSQYHQIRVKTGSDRARKDPEIMGLLKQRFDTMNSLQDEKRENLSG